MKVEIEAEALIKLIDALEFYANPDVYWACSFMFDRPTGGFDDDFSDFQEYKDFLDGSTPDCYYEDRARPGLNARKALRDLIENHKELLEKLVDLEQKAAKLQEYIAHSFKGRTKDFESLNLGSNPRWASKLVHSDFDSGG